MSQCIFFKIDDFLTVAVLLLLLRILNKGLVISQKHNPKVKSLVCLNVKNFFSH